MITKRIVSFVPGSRECGKCRLVPAVVEGGCEAGMGIPGETRGTQSEG